MSESSLGRVLYRFFHLGAAAVFCREYRTTQSCVNLRGRELLGRWAAETAVFNG
jgi:hypothetical protein